MPILLVVAVAIVPFGLLAIAAVLAPRCGCNRGFQIGLKTGSIVGIVGAVVAFSIAASYGPPPVPELIAFPGAPVLVLWCSAIGAACGPFVEFGLRRRGHPSAVPGPPQRSDGTRPIHPWLVWLVAAPMPIVGIVVGMYLSMNAFQKQVAAIRAASPDRQLCGLPVLPYLFMGLVGGSLGGIIAGAVIGELLAWLGRRRNRKKIDSA